MRDAGKYTVKVHETEKTYDHIVDGYDVYLQIRHIPAGMPFFMPILWRFISIPQISTMLRPI